MLTRKLGEAIAIGDDVKVIVMQIKGKQVRLGIKAGPHTSVHRDEIYEKIQQENKLASQATAESLRAALEPLAPVLGEALLRPARSLLRRRAKKPQNEEACELVESSEHGIK